MKAGTRLTILAGALVALVVVISVAVIVATRETQPAPAVPPAPPQTASAAAESVDSTSANLAEAADELITGAIGDATTETQEWEKDGKTFEVKTDKSLIEFSRVRVETAEELTFRKRIDMFHALTPYHVAEAALKEKVKGKYGQVTADRIDDLVTTAAALEESFWAQGDFDNSSAFDSIYEARALLESCLEVQPTNEGALKRLCDVISSGWPFYIYSGDDKTLQWEGLQRRMDLFTPMYTLWEAHLSKRAASTPEDMYYAADIVTATISFRRPEMLREYSEEFAQLNPNPSPALSALFSDGVPAEKGVAVAKWAIEGATANGPQWSCYSGWFRSWIDNFEKGTSNFDADCGFVHDNAPHPGDQPAEYYRTNMMRAYSFVGPEKRRARLIPEHVLLERVKENEAKYGRPKGT